MFDLVMLQVMVPEQHRDDDKHCDGGASLLHIGLSLHGRRRLRVWEIDREQPYEFTLEEGVVYLSSPACFSHQPLHRDDPADASSLKAFEGLDERMCKWAVQFRCALFMENRASCPPASPIRPFQSVAEVVAKWLAGMKVLLPSRDDILRELKPDQGDGELFAADGQGETLRASSTRG